MNLKNLKHFKKGIMELTPLQLSQGKLAGYVGMVIGLSCATVTSFIAGAWGIGIFLIFLTWFQTMGGIGEYQAYNGLKEMEKEFNANELNDLIQEEK